MRISVGADRIPKGKTEINDPINIDPDVIRLGIHSMFSFQPVAIFLYLTLPPDWAQHGSLFSSLQKYPKFTHRFW